MQMLLFQCNFIIFDVFHVISDFALQHGASFLNCWHALGESPASGIEGRGRRPAPAWAGVEVKCLSVVDFVCWCPTTWHFRICSSWYCNVTQETTLSQNYLWNYAMFHCAQQISSTSGRAAVGAKLEILMILIYFDASTVKFGPLPAGKDDDSTVTAESDLEILEVKASKTCISEWIWKVNHAYNLKQSFTLLQNSRLFQAFHYTHLPTWWLKFWNSNFTT